MFGLLQGPRKTFIHSFLKTALAIPLRLLLAKVAAVWQPHGPGWSSFKCHHANCSFKPKSRLEMPDLKCPSNTCFPSYKLATEINNNHAETTPFPSHSLASTKTISWSVCDKKMSQCGPLSTLKHRNERLWGTYATEPQNDRVFAVLDF